MVGSHYNNSACPIAGLLRLRNARQADGQRFQLPEASRGLGQTVQTEHRPQCRLFIRRSNRPRYFFNC
ncbi:hypothetical protein D3C86_2213940 [compost metagenome]